MKLFVYGSLKKGYWNHRLLQDAIFVGEAVTKKHYTLVNSGFPKAVTVDIGRKKAPVAGEVFEIDEKHLRYCDGLEGHPDFYTRATIQVVLDSGDVVDTYIYEYNHSSNQPSCTISNDIYSWVG